jgi:hypothetical protein
MNSWAPPRGFHEKMGRSAEAFKLQRDVRQVNHDAQAIGEWCEK